MRFLLIDKITELSPNKYAKGIKTISFEESFLKSPWEELGIYPRLLLLETASQLASWLIIYSTKFQKMPLLVRLGSLSMKRDVKCGDRLDLRVEIKSQNEEGAVIDALILIENEIVAEGKDCLCFFAPLVNFHNPDKIKALFNELTREAIFK